MILFGCHTQHQLMNICSVRYTLLCAKVSFYIFIRSHNRAKAEEWTNIASISRKSRTEKISLDAPMEERDFISFSAISLLISTE